MNDSYQHTCVNIKTYRDFYYEIFFTVNDNQPGDQKFTVRGILDLKNTTLFQKQMIIILRLLICFLLTFQ